MSKVICEVCGTTYPETSAQCPICGCARSGEVQAVRNSAGTASSGGQQYTHVKGGRFSKANVKKRTHTSGHPARQPDRQPVSRETKKQPKDRTDTVLTITVIFLLLAIVAVVLYIVFRFFDVGLPENSQPAGTTPPQSTTQSTQLSTTEPSTQLSETTDPPEVPCNSLTMDTTNIRLEKIGSATLLNVYPDPANTTDEMTYASSDESVATVTESGKVVAVSPGIAQITITCGNAQLICTVVCGAEEVAEPTTEATTEPTTEATTQPTTVPLVDFELNRSDFTLSSKGESWVLYNGSIPKTQIIWKSDNEDVATVDNGKVVAVGPGTTTIHAEYNGI